MNRMPLQFFLNVPENQFNAIFIDNFEMHLKATEYLVILPFIESKHQVILL
jgi:hypothetical protein